MKNAKVCILVVFLSTSLFSWSEPWYCIECNAVHRLVCPKALFEEEFHLTDQQIDMLDDIQASMEDLDCKSRIIVILSLMRHYKPTHLPSEIPDRKFVNWSFLNALFEDLNKAFCRKLMMLRKSSDLGEILWAFERLENYWRTEPHFDYFNVNMFKFEIENLLKYITQQCSFEDLGKVRSALEKCDGSSSDSIKVMQIVGKTLRISKDIKDDDFKWTDFLEIVRKIFITQYKKVEFLHKIEPILNDFPENETPEKIFELMNLQGDLKEKVKKMIEDIKALLESTEDISITDIIGKLIERFAFSFWGITVCRFLSHCMEMGYRI